MRHSVPRAIQPDPRTLSLVSLFGLKLTGFDYYWAGHEPFGVPHPRRACRVIALSHLFPWPDSESQAWTLGYGRVVLPRPDLVFAFCSADRVLLNLAIFMFPTHSGSALIWACTMSLFMSPPAPHCVLHSRESPYSASGRVTYDRRRMPGRNSSSSRIRRPFSDARTRRCEGVLANDSRLNSKL